MLVDNDGYSMLDAREQDLIERTFSNAPWLYSLLLDDSSKGEQEIQRGGNPTAGNPTAGNPTAGNPTAGNPTAADLSMDKMVNWIIQQTTAADEYMEKVKKGNPINRLLNTPVPAYPAITFRPIVTLLITLIDMIRLSAAATGETNIPLTLLVAIEELIEGKWRQMILTSLGFISPSGAAAGILLKILVDVWLLADPSLRSEYFRKSMGLAKSTLTGLILWSGNLLIPPPVKEQLLQRFKQIADPIVKKVEDAKARISQGVLGPGETGKRLEFTGLETEGIQKLAEGDLSRLPSVLRFTPLTCSAEGQQVIRQVQRVPYMQLVLELLNVPTTDQGKKEVCGETLNKPLATAIQLKLQNPKMKDA
jgi:hypothetical protein